MDIQTKEELINAFTAFDQRLSAIENSLQSDSEPSDQDPTDPAGDDNKDELQKLLEA